MLIVTPNLTTDRTVRLDELVPGGVHRTRRAVETLGGKGVNVARVARAFGLDAPVVGFVPVADEPRLCELARSEGADLVAVRCGGRSRSATVLIEAVGRVTVLNEPGPDVEERDWASLVGRIEQLAAGQQSLACLGSLPPGSPADAYARCCQTARRHGLRSVIDAAGAALHDVLPAEPDYVTPNLAEAEVLLGGRGGVELDPSGPEVIERAASAAAGLRERGARRAVVTIGRYGAVLAGPGGVLHCPAPAVAVVNPTGAGDSFVGGLVRALESGAADAEALCYGVATAAASCEQLLAGGIDPARVEQLVGRLESQRLDGAAGSAPPRRGVPEP